VKRTPLFAILLIANILFAIGLFAPCFTIHPGFGAFTSLIKSLQPDASTPQIVSIWGGISSLLHDGNYLLGIIILLFSVVFPLWKFGVLWSALIERESRQDQMKILQLTGKFSMLDIFVIAVVLVSIKGLPGSTSVSLNWGLFCFCAAIILSLCFPYWLKENDDGY
jgi:paraquat-inducible protein A